MIPLSDRLAGGLLTLLGMASWWFGRQLPPVRGQPVGPEAFPMWVGAALILCGVLIFIGIGRSYEIAAEADAEAYNRDIMEKTDEQEVTGLAKFKPLIPPFLLIFYVLASERIGFYLTAAVILGVLSYALKASVRQIMLLALIAPPCIHLIFYKLLRVPLPAGLIPFPWA